MICVKKRNANMRSKKNRWIAHLISVGAAITRGLMATTSDWPFSMIFISSLQTQLSDKLAQLSCWFQHILNLA